MGCEQPDTCHVGDLRGFIKETLSDVDGNWSSKRIITTIGMFLFIIAFFASTFWGFKLDTTIMNVLDTIIISGLAVTVAERFGKAFPEGGNPPGSKST